MEAFDSQKHPVTRLSRQEQRRQLREHPLFQQLVETLNGLPVDRRRLAVKAASGYGEEEQSEARVGGNGIPPTG